MTPQEANVYTRFLANFLRHQLHGSANIESPAARSFPYQTEDDVMRSHSFLQPMLLRRTKAELQIKGELENLPPKHIVVVAIQMKPKEANIYTRFLAFSQNLFIQFMNQNRHRNGLEGILDGSANIESPAARSFTYQTENGVMRSHSFL